MCQQGSPVSARIQALLAAPAVVRAHWGISVVDAGTGAPVWSVDDGQLFEPASNAKLFTTSAALALLGTATRLETRVVAEGEIDPAGRLHGALWLVGGGDPSLSGRSYPWTGKTVRDGAPAGALAELARQVAAAGVKVVEGGVVGDDRLFRSERYGSGWGWDDLQWEYGAPVSALAIADDVRYLTVSPGVRVGQPVVARWDDPFTPEGAADAQPPADTLPPPDAVSVAAITVAAAANAAPHLGVSREVDGGALRIFGTMPLGAKPMHLAVSMHDPALFAAQAFAVALERAGVTVQGKTVVAHQAPEDTQPFRAETRMPLTLQAPAPVAQAPVEGTVVARRTSPPLSDLVTVTDKVSQNLHAEMLLRLLGASVGTAGSVAQGVRVVRAFALGAGVDGADFSFVDGSGLAPADLVTPRAVTTLLVWARKQPWSATLAAALPVGGVDGSLAGRFTDPAIKGRVLAKTGTLAEVNALSGYLTAASGRVLAFSVLVNDATDQEACRKTMDEVVGAIASAY